MTTTSQGLSQSLNLANQIQTVGPSLAGERTNICKMYK